MEIQACYKILSHYNIKNIDDIREIIKKGLIDEIIVLPFYVADYAVNWKEAQDICIELSEHENENVRANAAQGLGNIARIDGKLEKHIVKPVLLKLFKECTAAYKEMVLNGIEDVNFFLKWNIGKKAIKKYEIELNSVRQHST